MNNRRQFARDIAIAGLALHQPSLLRFGESGRGETVPYQTPEGVKVITMEAGMTIHDLHKAMKENESAVIIVANVSNISMDAVNKLGASFGMAARVNEIIQIKEAKPKLATFSPPITRRERRAAERRARKHG